MTARFKDGSRYGRARDLLKEAAGGDEPFILVKQAPEKRITTGIMYAPDLVDAHGEFAEAEDLEDAVHEYMAGGDLRVRKQHGKEVIGNIVGIISWPFAHEVELKPTTELEKARKVKLPPGTVYATVKWTESGWDEVKKGKIRGLSMGGTAVRLRS